MTKQQEKGLTIPINFCLSASDTDLDNFELARLAEQSDCTAQAYEFLERAIDCAAQARVIRWFRSQDRQALQHAIEGEETAEEWARRKIRESQRSPEELLPRPSLPPGSAHLAASLRYQQRNISEGKCRYCPKPQDPNSAELCTEHLAKARHRAARKRGVKGEPGTADYLYGEITESLHGRKLGTLASLAKNREKKSREILAELGLPLDSVAVGVKAGIEALLKMMPESKADAMTQAKLFEKAGVVTKTTGQRALQQLLYTGEIRRFGKGGPLDPYRYFKSGEEPTETRKPKHLSRTKQNEALLNVMRGEERNKE